MDRQINRVLRACAGNGTITGITEANHAIVTAGRLRRTDDAMKIFRSLPNLGFSPDLMSFNNAIWCAGNGGRLDLSKSIFNELMETKNLRPNVYTYGSLMHACARAKNHQLALKYLNQMIENGIVPNQVVFTSAMEACAMSGNYKEALLVMDRMKKNNLRPDLTMVNAAIKACCLGGAMDDAEELASTLRDFGAMDLFTYHTLMMGNTKLARHQRVLSLYEEALQSNAQLDGGIYSLAMLAALNCGLYQQVPRIAEKARSEGVPLTEASYTILIQALGEAGGADQAVDCLDTMISEGLKPNVNYRL
jgi:pentatricopeptide repeat domain-containing protein 1